MHIKGRNYHLVVEWTRYMTIGIDERNVGIVLNWYSHDFSSIKFPKATKSGIALTLFLGFGEWAVEAWHMKEERCT